MPRRSGSGRAAAWCCADGEAVAARRRAAGGAARALRARGAAAGAAPASARRRAARSPTRFPHLRETLAAHTPRPRRRAVGGARPAHRRLAAGAGVRAERPRAVAARRAGWPTSAVLFEQTPERGWVRAAAARASGAGDRRPARRAPAPRRRPRRARRRRPSSRRRPSGEVWIEPPDPAASAPRRRLAARRCRWHRRAHAAPEPDWPDRASAGGCAPRAARMEALGRGVGAAAAGRRVLRHRARAPPARRRSRGCAAPAHRRQRRRLVRGLGRMGGRRAAARPRPISPSCAPRATRFVKLVVGLGAARHRRRCTTTPPRCWPISASSAASGEQRLSIWQLAGAQPESLDGARTLRRRRRDAARRRGACASGSPPSPACRTVPLPAGVHRGAAPVPAPRPRLPGLHLVARHRRRAGRRHGAGQDGAGAGLAAAPARAGSRRRPEPGRLPGLGGAQLGARGGALHARPARAAADQRQDAPRAARRDPARTTWSSPTTRCCAATSRPGAASTLRAVDPRRGAEHQEPRRGGDARRARRCRRATAWR